MINKLYLTVLSIFIIFLFFVNSLSVLFSSKEHFINLFYVRQRAVASIKIMKHIFIESGLILKPASKEDISIEINNAALLYNISPKLLTCISGDIGQYAIYPDGRMGVMKVKSFMLLDGADPYNVKNNIESAAFYLSELLKTHSLADSIDKYMGNGYDAEDVYKCSIT